MKNWLKTRSDNLDDFMEKEVDNNWDFALENTKYFTHGIHPYPAMMIPQISRRLIAEEGKGASTALDPFCGSGSVLLEFKLAGINCYGNDINPLAMLISNVKTTPINPVELEKNWRIAQGKITFGTNILPKIPTFTNMEYWFKPSVIKRLSVIKHVLDKINDENIKDFFMVCFSETVRKVSNTRGGEFKLYRMPEEKLAVYKPDVDKVFSKIVERNIEAMSQFYTTYMSGLKKTSWVKLLNENFTQKTSLKSKSIDLIVTSPPYGDSRTTVAYGQFTRLSLQWLGFPDDLVKRLDKDGLGGINNHEKVELNSDTLKKILLKIGEKDERRAGDVLSFFIDFYKCVEEMDRVLSDDGKICIVIGNRTVKEIKIPTDRIFVELFESLGYKHKRTVVRRIPNKRMPKRNSPTNIVGKTVSTMNEENIIVLYK